MKRIVTLCIFLWPSTAHSTPSCESPLRIDKQTVIELTEDIIISAQGTPIIASEFFALTGPQKVIITSTKGHAIIVESNSTWDLSSFNNTKKIIEFSGNARLVCKPGSKLLCNKGLLRFAGSSQWILE